MSWIVLAALAALTDGEATPAGAPAEAPAEVQPALATPEATEAPEAVALQEPTPAEQKARERSQELVSGAPLYNPNVAVHIVQHKPFADRGLSELVLYPAVP